MYCLWWSLLQFHYMFMFPQPHLYESIVTEQLHVSSASEDYCYLSVWTVIWRLCLVSTELYYHLLDSNIDGVYSTKSHNANQSKNYFDLFQNLLGPSLQPLLHTSFMKIGSVFFFC